jgi:hypothetical protein
MKICIGEEAFLEIIPAKISNDSIKMAKLNEYKKRQTIENEIENMDDDNDQMDIIQILPNHINEKLINANWKERKEGLETINGILCDDDRLLRNNQNIAGLIETFTKVNYFC